MPMIDQFRRKVQRASVNIAKLQNDKSSLAKKRADLQKKITAVNKTVATTRSISTKNMKQREIERLHKESSDNESKIASIDGRIAAEQKKLNDAQKSLSNEEVKEAKKQQREADQLGRQTKRQMAVMGTNLKKQNILYAGAMSEIEKLKNLPEKITVLFLASNPLDQAQLRLDEEARAIQDMIRKSEHRDAVKLESRWAVRPRDVMQAINECNPRIVHFSGHGSDHDEIVFQDESGNAKPVTKEAIVQAMGACSGSIQLVVFNTCYSKNQAEAVVEHIQAAVGMNTSIGDDAARTFASQFYSAIGFGKSVKEAFDQAKAALMLESIPEEETPELFVADGFDASNLYIVRPPCSTYSIELTS